MVQHPEGADGPGPEEGTAAGQLLQLLYLLVSLNTPALGEVVLVLQDLLLTSPIEGLIDDMWNWSRVGWAWAVGLGWCVATTAIGCWSFHKREIS